MSAAAPPTNVESQTCYEYFDPLDPDSNTMVAIRFTAEKTIPPTISDATAAAAPESP